MSEPKRARTHDVPPNVRLYAAGTTSWRPLAELVGCAGAIAALDNAIEKRRSCARAIYAAMRLPRALVLCGAAGAGKRTLVRAYAQHVDLNLVELDEWCGALEPADVEAAYALAERTPPCIVFIGGCDAALLAPPTAAAQNAPHATTVAAQPTLLQRTLAARLAAAERAAAHPWSVLALERPYTALPPALDAFVYYRCWVAPPSYARGAAAPDGGAARRALLERFMRERAPHASGFEQSRFYTKCFPMILEACTHATPRQIARFLDRVFYAPLERIGAGAINTSNPDALLPEPREVIQRLHALSDNIFCITPQIPDLETVRPFESLPVLASR